MGINGSYDHHHSIHRHQFHQKATFLPIFCRLSIRDIKSNHRRKDPTASDEPSSPKVSCMGQVKRNNRVIGFPGATTTATATTTVATRHHRYSKIRRLFSSKSLLPPATSSSVPAAAGGGRSGSKSCRSSGEMCTSEGRRLKEENGVKCEKKDFVKVVDVGELDPPLPVVKRVPPPGCGEVNIWKRRFNGPALRSLQIERVNLQNNRTQLPPTV